jgi:MHS family proline/betaine transporter-like MFS transporter
MCYDLLWLLLGKLIIIFSFFLDVQWAVCSDYWTWFLFFSFPRYSYGTSYYFCVVYLPEFVNTTKGMTESEISLASFIVSVELAILPCIFGALSDYVGRKGVAAVATVIALAFAPLVVFFHSPTLYQSAAPFGVLLALQLLLGAASTALGASTVCISSEPFPTSCRLSAFAIGYNIASVIVGLVPLMCEAARAAGGDWAPAYVALAGTVVALPAVFMGPETAFVPLPF